MVACSWAHPGADPYTGSVQDALEHYAIPAADRQTLALKIHAKASDGLLTVTKDRVMSGDRKFAPLMLMHFGKNKLCYGVDRSAWNLTHQEHGDLYCSGWSCVVVFHVCGNVTQVFQKGRSSPLAPGLVGASRQSPHGTPGANAASLQERAAKATPSGADLGIGPGAGLANQDNLPTPEIGQEPGVASTQIPEPGTFVLLFAPLLWLLTVGMRTLAAKD